MEAKSGVDHESAGWEELASGEIYVDAEGEWFYQGNKLVREDILAFFYEHLEHGPNGLFTIVWRDQRCVLNVDDTPWVITRVDRDSSEGEDLLRLTLKHLPLPESLDPQSLWVGKDNVLYARVRSGRFPARFSRPAYYQIAEWIQEDPDSGEFFLEVRGTRYPVR